MPVNGCQWHFDREHDKSWDFWVPFLSANHLIGGTDPCSSTPAFEKVASAMPGDVNPNS